MIRIKTKPSIERNGYTSVKTSMITPKMNHNKHNYDPYSQIINLIPSSLNHPFLKYSLYFFIFKLIFYSTPVIPLPMHISSIKLLQKFVTT